MPGAQGATRLQVFLVWREMLLGYRLLADGGRVTLGPSKRATFPLQRLDGYPKRFLLLRRDRRKGGFVLRLGPGMRGNLTEGGTAATVEEVLGRPAESRALRKGPFRETALRPGDKATVTLEAHGGLKLLVSHTEAPETIGKPRPIRDQPLLLRTITGTSLCLALFVTVAFIIHDRMPQDLNLTPERFANLEALRSLVPDPEVMEQAKNLKRKEEEATSKAMKGEKGKLGLKDAPKQETILPKGREDVLRDKVAKKGILGIIGSSRPAGSGLGKLFANTQSDMDTALNGLAGAQLQVGRGSGGLSTSGTGTGGGGTGLGRIYGTGDIETGGGRGGKGRGPSFGGRQAKEVEVSVTTGDADTDGSLSKEQVNRVVRAHASAIKYCYEKELQRAPALSGKIDVYWVIEAEGRVEKASIASSSMSNAAVEGCITRQVKQWQFPKAAAQTIVQRYPFVFKGGV